MSIQLVPFFNEPIWQASMTFEGTTFGMYFAYNQRCASWYMSVADADGVDIYNGVKLVTGFSLLKKCADPRKPRGAFIVWSATSDQSPPQLNELLPGGRCRLVYVTSDWVALFRAGNTAQINALLDANAQASGLSTYGQG